VSSEYLAGYLPIETDEAIGYAFAGTAEWVATTLRQHGTLREWARAESRETLGGGRGPVRKLVAPLVGPDGRTHWVCRPYARGGLVASLLHDRYFRFAGYRPVDELLASQISRARGVRTPAVIAAVSYPRGPFYRADLITELVPESISLADALFGRASSAPRDAFLIAAGRLLRSLEAAGVRHADLNAHNVLVASAGNREAWAIDLDRCRVREASPTPSAMRARLERSLTKLGEQHTRPLTAVEWTALRDGYMGE
jgi:3-deoxy-D-manno-octulosonic acid kinase